MSSAPPPAGPPPRLPPPGWQQPPNSPDRGGGSIWLGIVVGVVVIGLFLFVVPSMMNLVIGSMGPSGPAANLVFLSWIPPLAYLVASIVLAVRPPTARFGAGLLLAIGVWFLIGAGLCIVLFSSMGSG